MKMECNFFTGAARILNHETSMDVIREMIKEPGREDPFYVLDVGEVVQKIKAWKLKMPRIKPFYAVKCNNNPTVLELLAALGTGFDCASKNEVKTILDLGVDPSRIIYANPCKPASHLRFAAKVQVPLMTFDNETELYKVKDYYPDAQLVLRIRCDATDVQCSLGMKFGVLPKDAEALLITARALDLNIVGVSFHVGSGCREPSVFTRAISEARKVFDMAEELGYKPDLLDIGGGFLGNRGSSLDEVAQYINAALDQDFPESSGVKIISEPGRYMVMSAFTLATNVLAKREVTDDDGKHVSTMYYINDGIYGSFNNTLFDHQDVYPTLPQEEVPEEPLKHCTIWGPTCDGLDKVVPEAQLPSLQCGDWLVWQDMGAYTLACASEFNGFPRPSVHIVIPHHTWLYLEDYLGCVINFTPNNDASAKCSAAAPATPALMGPSQPCSATNYSNKMEDQMALLNLIDMGEM